MQIHAAPVFAPRANTEKDSWRIIYVFTVGFVPGGTVAGVTPIMLGDTRMSFPTVEVPPPLKMSEESDWNLKEGSQSCAGIADMDLNMGKQN